MAEVFFGPEKSFLLRRRDHCFGRSPGRDELFELRYFLGGDWLPGILFMFCAPGIGLDYAASSLSGFAYKERPTYPIR